ncbi:glycosyltransferase family 2 protein [Microbacterium sp. TNHR37B]|uniref:glycosyltransferase family 2 protein n=1 Tax=Microbacterium sp. TNHR37B TaxID=1775956 RepID=UPI0007B2CE19|nr:glycosyltransferase family 2 protein [Microbacterium sp. TNHR37B]KZE89217.1 Cellulose synthase catalytic subunit [UDP-forming] [Microbacterium sp. TNHR37B]
MRRLVGRLLPAVAVVLVGLLASVLALWAMSAGAAAGVATVFVVASLVLWSTGFRSVTLWGRAAVAGRSDREDDRELAPAPDLRIALVYCVADDADLPAIAASMRQDVPVATVILDDSRDPAARARLDAFAAAHGCRIIRRAQRGGYKAGNLNHGFAALRGEFDAYLLCDSDVVLPPDLARRCASALADPTVAVAQALPTARPGRSWFSRYFGPLLETHLETTRRGREAAGVVALLGRGALVRAAAIDDVGGVPEVVAEDLALSVALRRRGWRLVNVDVAFAEDYPIDYRSFRTQMRKTTEGAVEFLRRPGQLRGWQGRGRLDVLLETALVPLAALAGVAAMVSGVSLAMHGATPPLWAMVLTAVSALAPLLPEAARRARVHRPVAGVVFLLLTGLLYSSAMFVVLSAVVRTAIGRRAVFWITPKAQRTLGARQLLDLLRAELVLAPAIAVAALVASGSPAAALAPLGPVLCALAFAATLVSRRAVGQQAPVMSAVAAVLPDPSRRAMTGVGARA